MLANFHAQGAACGLQCPKIPIIEVSKLVGVVQVLFRASSSSKRSSCHSSMFITLSSITTPLFLGRV
jgi:hypothetical protein